jgi:hypothetical protein
VKVEAALLSKAVGGLLGRTVGNPRCAKRGAGLVFLRGQCCALTSAASGERRAQTVCTGAQP